MTTGRIPADPRILVALLFVLLMVACGHSGNGVLDSIESGSRITVPAGEAAGQAETRSADAVIAEIEGFTAREIPADILADIKAELIKYISSSDTRTYSESAPVGTINQISDLSAIGETGGLVLSWREVNVGDYNQDGQVGSADITPIGVHWGAVRGGDDWDNARAADGNADGMITAADLTPLGQNYLRTVSGYNIYRAGLNGDFELIGTVERSTADQAAPAVLLYTYKDTTGDAAAEYTYSVRPYCALDNSEGEASTAVSVYGQWSMGAPHNNDVIEVDPGDGSMVKAIKDELLIAFDSEPSPERLREVVYTELDGQLLGRVPGTNSYRVRVTGSDRSASSVMESRAVSAAADYIAEYDILMEPFEAAPLRTTSLIVNDALRSDLWGLDVIYANNAWDIFTGSGVRTCVIDTGIETSHEDLVCTLGVRIGDDGSYPDWQNDLNGHGTHVAGTVAATGQNSVGVVGVAFNATLMFVRAGNMYSGDWLFPSSDTASGLDWARTNGAKVINLSLGGSSPWGTTGLTALANCESAGVVVVAAAGNDNSSAVHYPAGHPTVLSVGSCTPALTKSPFSNYGTSWVDVCAPGGDGTYNGAILSTVMDLPLSQYDRKQGTSMACPHAAGLATLILGVDGSLSAQDVRDVIENTGRSIAASSTVGPLIDCNAALSSLATGYNISGTITDGTDPLPGVTVSLTGNGSQTTDSNGDYEFVNINDGSYTLTPVLAGWRFSPATINVTVAGGDQTAQDFTATPNVISGTILDDLGAPVNGITVTITGGTQVTTNASGEYLFNLVENGTYTITPAMAGYSFVPATISGVVINDNDATGQDFTADANVVSGNVTDGSNPLQGVTIALGGFGTDTTDASGNYEFRVVPNGGYTITPSFAGYNFAPASINITVADGDDTGNDFVGTPASAKVSGTIVDDSANPMAGVTVAIPGITSQTTDGAGFYEFVGVANGNHTVTPSQAGWAFSPASRSVTVAGSDLTGNDFVGEIEKTVSGTILDGGGTPLQGITVSLTGHPDQTTDASGDYTFPGVTDGSYTITPAYTGWHFTPASLSVTVAGSNLINQDFTGARNTISGVVTWSGSPLSGVTITLSGVGTQVTDVTGAYEFTTVANGSYTVTPSRTGYRFVPVSRSVTVSDDTPTADFAALANTISGTITKNTGGGLAGATVNLSGVGNTITNGAGYYQFVAVPNGARTITPSLGTAWGFVPDHIDLTVSDDDHAGQDFTAIAVTYIVSGYITEDGAGLSGITVTLDDNDGYNPSTSTNGSGYFEFPTVPEGTYFLTPSNGSYGFTPETREVNVYGGDMPDQNFAATAGTYSVSGNVSTDDGSPLAGVTLTLTAHGSTATTDALGDYTFTGVIGGSHTLTPSLAGYTFTPESTTFDVSGNIENKDFTATEITNPPGTYSVSGMVARSNGTGVAGVTLTLTGTGGPYQVYSNSSGLFVLTGVPNGSYTLTPSRSGLTFTPTNLSVTVAGSDLSGQDFTAY